MTVSRRFMWIVSLTCLAMALEVALLLARYVSSSEPPSAALLFGFPVTVLLSAMLLATFHARIQGDLERHAAERRRDADARELIGLLAQRFMTADALPAFLDLVPPLLVERLRVARVDVLLGAPGRVEARAAHEDRAARAAPSALQVVVPILGRGEPIGQLSVSPRAGERADGLQDALLLISSYLASAVERMWAADDMRRARDQALESARLKSEFLATMSHEIRTPLHGVLGMNALLLDSDLSPDQREQAETVRRSSEHLLTLLNDILDLSKIEADRLELEQVEFDLERTVRDAVSLLAERAQQKGLTLACAMHTGLPRKVRGDPGRLRQVLLNLVGNALKFTERGGVEVRARVVDQTDDEALVRLDIIDTGPGVPPAVQARLFQPFSQADSSTTRRHGGSGLGLAISKRLASLMGGEIGVESEAGQGSRFWFTARFQVRHAQARFTSTRISQVRCPLPSRNAPRSMPRPTEVELAGTRDERPVVLVAEDNPVNQALAVRMLEKLGFRADVVQNGAEAVRAVAQREYACILMDCQMPTMDGYEATARIRQQGRRTPIIALTASAMQGDRERCIVVGMDEYLSKPVRLEVLRDALERLCRPIDPPTSSSLPRTLARA